MGCITTAPSQSKSMSPLLLEISPIADAELPVVATGELGENTQWISPNDPELMKHVIATIRAVVIANKSEFRDAVRRHAKLAEQCERWHQLQRQHYECVIAGDTDPAFAKISYGMVRDKKRCEGFPAAYFRPVLAKEASIWLAESSWQLSYVHWTNDETPVGEFIRAALRGQFFKLASGEFEKLEPETRVGVIALDGWVPAALEASRMPPLLVNPHIDDPNTMDFELSFLLAFHEAHSGVPPLFNVEIVATTEDDFVWESAEYELFKFFMEIASEMPAEELDPILAQTVDRLRHRARVLRTQKSNLRRTKAGRPQEPTTRQRLEFSALFIKAGEARPTFGWVELARRYQAAIMQNPGMIEDPNGLGSGLRHTWNGAHAAKKKKKK